MTTPASTSAPTASDDPAAPLRIRSDDRTARGEGLIARWADRIDVDDATPRLTIGEGGTPLVHARRLSERLGVELHLKLELANPTGSFKDRGMCVAVARAVQAGATTLICASTGNTSASAAAFAAAAGLQCVVIVPTGKIAAGKLLQAQVAGALVIQIDGSFDDGLAAVRELSTRPGIALVNSVNEYRIEGQKTGAFEVVEDLGGTAPDWLCIPVGNAGNITAYWRGFTELHASGELTSLPRLLGVQAAGAAPLVDGHDIERPETLATAIRIGRPARGDQALAAVADSRGQLRKRTDEQLVEAYALLAKDAGIFCEPASAISVAGLIDAIHDGTIARGSRVVCVLTGHGLKDPDTAATIVQPTIACGPSAAAIAAVIDANA
ncbi:MAG: Threonine synthase [Thermoleophilia bacterium]|nr:Threonine synthase [Thermoleophilia bacterium]